jgi:hypothetical protein
MVAGSLLIDSLASFLVLGADWSGAESESKSLLDWIYWNCSFHSWPELSGMVGSALMAGGYLRNRKTRGKEPKNDCSPDDKAEFPVCG